MEELWETINDKYQISNFGRIKNIKTKRILKCRKNYRGYLKTNLSINGELKTIFPHRLVAEKFIPNPNNLPIVNHKDENKTNNCVDNLEWCNNIYNINYGMAQKRKSEKISKKVVQYDLNNNKINEFLSIIQASESINGNSGCISRVCKGKRKTYKGYIWKYKI